jgi:hypothetical protein
MAGSEGSAGEDQPTQVFPGQDAVVVTRLVQPPDAEPQPATETTEPQAATEVVPEQAATQVVPQHPPTEVAAPGPATDAAPAHPPTEVASPAPANQVAPTHPPTEVADSPVAPAPESTADAMPAKPAAGIIRYGPGVPVVLPVSQGGRTAEHVWRGTQPPAPPRRSSRARRLGGSALTVVLLVASGVILFLRFYHPAFQVTGATVSQHTAAGCRVDVVGRVTTNGSAGTVTYRWLFQPGGQQATTLNQSVSSGQHAVDVTAALEGQGQGAGSQTATLQVLSPDRRTASTRVTLNC